MIQGKVALITGSASGIGLAVARRLAAQGAAVVLNGFGDAAAIDKLRASIADECKVPVRYSGADMSKPEEIGAMIADAERELGALDDILERLGFVAKVVGPATTDASAFLRAKLGEALSRRRLAPYIFETEEEALSQLRSERTATSFTTSGA